MTSRPVRLLTATLVLLGLGQCLGAVAAAFDPKTMMDTPEIRRGMTAVGKTVFAGATITKFHLRVLDVMKKANSGGDMILARVLDGPCIARQSGIIGGMSGSPVYINGRLIGAIAYGWGFAREPIAGITAIRDMLGAMDLLATAGKQTGSLPRIEGQRWAAAAPVRIGGQTYHAAQVVTGPQALPPGVMPLRLVGPTICCTGFGPRAMALVTKTLKPFGLEPLATGGAQAGPVPLSLAPGAALGIRMMEGDFDMTGIGTVTYRDGDRLLGFGHPMLQRGRVAMPICTAWIHDFVPSFQRSDKMGSGVTDVGTLQADTTWSVGGAVGPLPVMRPAEIEIVDQTRNLRRVFHVRVLMERGVTPGLLVSGVAAALEAAYNPAAEGMVRTSFEIYGTRGAHVARQDIVYAGDSPVGPAIAAIADVMQLMEGNRWEPQDVARMKFRAELNARDETAFIEKARTEETVAKAGKPLHLHIQVRPDGAPPQDYPFTLDLPRDLPKGALRIAVVGGQEAMMHRSRLGILMPTFDNLAGVFAQFEKTEDNRQLCVIAALPQQGLMVGVTPLRQLPAAVGALFERSSRTDVDKGREELTLTRDLPWVLLGRAMLALPIEDRQGGKGTATAGGKLPPESEKGSSADEKSSLNPPPDRLWWAASAFAAPRSARETWPAADDADNKPRPLDPGDKISHSKETPATPAAAAPQKNPIHKDEDAKPEPETTQAKTVLRQPTVWTQEKLTDFAVGEEKGTTLRSEGGVSLAPATTELGTLSELYVLAAAAVGEDTFLATANPGRIYRVKPDGKPELLFDTKEFAVRALAADSAGNLYAGTFPGGKVYKLTPDGKGAVFCRLDADYVWCLAFTKAGQLLAGTGPGGRAFAIDAQGQATELARVPHHHVLSLLPIGDAVYLGTSGSGLVYRLAADRRLEAVYDADDQDVTSLAADDQGRVYAGLAPEGRIVRLQSGAPPTVIFEEKGSPVYSLAYASGRLYVGTGNEGKLLASLGDGVYELVRDTGSTHVASLTTTAGGSLLCGLANPGQALRLSPTAAAEGTFTSAVLDTGRLAQWGLVDWLADLPAAAKLAVRTRTGDSSDPENGSWSDWSGPYANPGVDHVSSPPARYLQYRLELGKGPGDGVPFLRRLSLSYLPANQKPEAKLEAPETDKPVHAQVEIKWSASDPEKDQLLATLESRPAGKADWQKLAELAADKKTWKWDTTKVSDGSYDLRITVTDEPSNPGAGLTDTAMLYGVVVDNAKPTLTITKTAAQDGKLLVEGTASDNLRVVEVAYQKGEQWYGVAAADGRFDSAQEAFSFTVPLEKDKAEVKVQVRDAAGNVATQTVKWPQ
jgi:outer membrane protein assembly factor BamB